MASLHHSRRQEPVLGLAENWRQFSLLVLVTAFVGAMVGLERSVFPLLATEEFGLRSTAAALSFITSFGLTKALTNLASGWLVDRYGRRGILIVGWVLALPVPFVVLLAPTWTWIVIANAVLGISQGLTWSTTVIMKIDLVGPRHRGLAMGLNEFAGYVAVAIAAALSAQLASDAGLREGPAYLGIGIALAGLFVSVLAVRDTTGHVDAEESAQAAAPGDGRPALRDLLRRSLWGDRQLFSLSQAGMVNNLNDGMMWGLLPLLLANAGVGLGHAGWLIALYPATWGICQPWTGALSDRWSRKPMIVIGMLVQGVALMGIAATRAVGAWAVGLIALGIGTALVYPTLLAAVGNIARPSARAVTVGVYRMWRDLGYAAGAIVTGLLADSIGITGTVAIVGALTAVSGVSFALRFREKPLPAAPTYRLVNSSVAGVE